MQVDWDMTTKPSLAALMMLVACLVVTLAWPLSTHAEVPSTCQGSYEDRDGDGRPDTLLVTGCSFATDRDSVTVFDRNGNLDPSKDWTENLDMLDDLWVFDAGAQDRASLIIDFHRQGEAVVAAIYDDYDGDGRVAYEVVEGIPTITESRYPVLTVTAADGWWLREGKVNFNLVVQVDGDVRASFLSFVNYMRAYRTDLLPGLLNGTIDAVIRVHDLDHDGRADYEVRQIYTPPEAYASVSTELMVNTAGDEEPFQDWTLWPHLGPPSDYIKPWGGSIAPIQVDWKRARIVTVGEFVASRGQDANWFIYSVSRFGEDGQTHANFENPFAFYDLAEDDDGFPELMIRSQYAGPNDAYFRMGQFKQAIEAIRYSWDQDNDSGLDFKVDLLGRYEITDTVTLPDLTVRTVPYERFPNWVMERPWDTAVFVAADGRRYGSTEGIYEGLITDWYSYYVTGIKDAPDLERVRDIGEGLRLEYSPEYMKQPWLYVSRIDHKLHLQGAWAGVWNLDGTRRLRYEDLDRDGWLDQWTVTITVTDTVTDEEALAGHPAPEPSEVVEKTLQLAHGVLLYADANRVTLLRATVTPSLFEALPPRDHAEWLALGAQLEQHKPTMAPDDLAGMLQQFQGPTTDLVGATMDGFRHTAQGLRFVLRLAHGFYAVADDIGLGAARLDPGAYIVTYDGSFQTAALTPAQLTLRPQDWSFEPFAPQRLAWVTVRATVHNDGLADVRSLPVRLYASQEGAPPRLLAQQQLDVNAQGTGRIEARWAPPSEGVWTVWVEVSSDDAAAGAIEVGPLAQMVIGVGAVAMPEMFRPLAPFDAIRFTWPVALLLSGTALAAVCVLAVILMHGTHLPAQQTTKED